MFLKRRPTTVQLFSSKLMTGSGEASQEGRFAPLAPQPVPAPGGMPTTGVQGGDSTPLGPEWL